MARLIYAIVLGIVGAGIVHIAVLFLVPAYSERDAWSALSQQANYYAVTRLDPAGQAPVIGSLDPLFDAVACRFDLSDGEIRVHGDGSVPYWSMSVYDRSGQNIFSVNDRSSAGGTLDFVIGTPVQMVGLRNDMPADYDASIFVEADTSEGMVVVRVFAPDETWEPTISAYLDEISCSLR